MGPDVAVVTGGAGGLGELLVRALAAGGRHVLVADRDAHAAGTLVADVVQHGGTASFVEVDLLEPDAVATVLARADEIGRLRLLVNDAGGWLPGEQYPHTDAWMRSLQLNLVVPMLATQHALPRLRDGGAVVNVSSSGGTGTGAYGSPEYGAAKAGLVRFTTAAADFADRFGVRVSCVVPHWIGLPRAVREHAGMSADERRRSGGLVDPALVVRVVLDLAEAPDSAGRVVVVRADRPPYVISGAMDPTPP